MGNESHELLVALMGEYDKKRSAQIKGLKEGIEANFHSLDLQLENIREDIKKNGRENQGTINEVDKLKNDLQVPRFIGSHLKISIFIGIVFLIGFLTLLRYLNKEQVESLIKSMIGF